MNFNVLDFALYLLSDERVQKEIKAAKNSTDLLARLGPVIIRDYLRPDLARIDRVVKDSRNMRELGIRLLTDWQERGTDGDVNEGGRVIQFGHDVSPDITDVAGGHKG